MPGFWGKVWWIIPHLYYFLKLEISQHAPIQPFRARSGQSSSASQDDCGQAFLDELHEFISQIGSQTMPWQQSSYSYFVGSRVHACLGVTFTHNPSRLSLHTTHIAPGNHLPTSHTQNQSIISPYHTHSLRQSSPHITHAIPVNYLSIPHT